MFCASSYVALNIPCNIALKFLIYPRYPVYRCERERYTTDITTSWASTVCIEWLEKSKIIMKQLNVQLGFENQFLYFTKGCIKSKDFVKSVPVKLSFGCSCEVKSARSSNLISNKREWNNC